MFTPSALNHVYVSALLLSKFAQHSLRSVPRGRRKAAVPEGGEAKRRELGTAASPRSPHRTLPAICSEDCLIESLVRKIEPGGTRVV